MNLREKKRLAARMLGVGADRIWMDPSRAEDIESAITRDDIRRLIKGGAIRVKPQGGTSRGRIRDMRAKKEAGRRGGHGSRKGAKRARKPRKRTWVQTVRPLRRRVNELKKEGAISSSEYRKLYLMIKGGTFRSRAHLEMYLREKGLVK
ncbi:MAG: 50S ribosomal protein L19e [Candidatus Hadarchaeales archaeon]